MIILCSALTLCLVAVLAITADARHVKKTRTRGNAKMLSLIEKMKQRVSTLGFRAQIRDNDECDGQICDGGICCPPYDGWQCCDVDSDYTCRSDAPDARSCYDATEKTKASARMNPLLMKMKKHAKARKLVGDDCPGGQICPGGWCCDAVFTDMGYVCCDEDDYAVCSWDADSCASDAKEMTKAHARMNPLLMKMKMHASEVKEHVADDDDCVGQVCPGDWCCPAEYADWTCCDEDSDYICVLDPADC